jgi:hypothetical protein
MTQDEILLDCDETAPPPGAATAGCRDEAMASMIATEAAKRSSEEKTRRQGDGVNVEGVDGFVIIELRVI